MGSRRDPLPHRGGHQPRYRHHEPPFRRRPVADLVRARPPHHQGQDPLLLARFLRRLQGGREFLAFPCLLIMLQSTYSPVTCGFDRPVSSPPRTSTSSSLPPRVLDEPSELSSRRVEESTRPLPSGRTLPARPLRRPVPSVSPSVRGTCMRRPSRRRSSLTCTESEVSCVKVFASSPLSFR